MVLRHMTILAIWLPHLVHVRACESNIIFPSVRPSCYLLLNHRNQTCYLTSPSGKGVRKQHYFSVCPSVRHAISSYTYGRNLPKLATWLTRVVRVCKSNIIFHFSLLIGESVEICEGVPSTARSYFFFFFFFFFFLFYIWCLWRLLSLLS